MWIKRQVVMLPTEKAENCLLYGSNRLRFHKGYFTQEFLKSCNTKSYHLYILSDEKIKEGDLVYRCNSKDIFKVDSFLIHLIERGSTEICKKIIATTDKSLSPRIHKGETVDESYPKEFREGILSQPSQSFINKFIEQYDKGNVITEVIVEYEKVCANCGKHLRAHRFGTCPDKLHLEKTTLVDTYGESVNADYALKIDPKDNTISIRKIKDSWNREEVKTLLNSLIKADFLDFTNEYGITGWKAFDKWIEENL